MSNPVINKESEFQGESLTGKLSKSQIFRDYQSAFESATGLPLTLHEAGGPQGELSRRPGGNDFCSLMAQCSPSCSSCFSLQKELEHQTGIEPRTLQCFAGLCESAVPVRVGEKVIAFLQTGQILLHRPDSKQFSNVAKTLIAMGIEFDYKKAEEAWIATTVLKETQYYSMLRLLQIFAGHLSECANTLSLEAQGEEAAPITRAKAIILANLDDEISLAGIAKVVNVSAGYFSELFHKATGLTFTDYVARVRVEKVKILLANPNLQITAIAYDTGFKSLSQFNRVFRRVCGVSPREFRMNLTA